MCLCIKVIKKDKRWRSNKNKSRKKTQPWCWIFFTSIHWHQRDALCPPLWHIVTQLLSQWLARVCAHRHQRLPVRNLSAPGNICSRSFQYSYDVRCDLPSGKKRKQARLFAALDALISLPIRSVKSSSHHFPPRLQDLPTPRGNHGLIMSGPLLIEVALHYFVPCWGTNGARGPPPDGHNDSFPSFQSAAKALYRSKSFPSFHKRHAGKKHGSHKSRVATKAGLPSQCIGSKSYWTIVW